MPKVIHQVGARTGTLFFSEGNPNHKSLGAWDTWDPLNLFLLFKFQTISNPTSTRMGSGQVVLGGLDSNHDPQRWRQSWWDDFCKSHPGFEYRTGEKIGCFEFIHFPTHSIHFHPPGRRCFRRFERTTAVASNVRCPEHLCRAPCYPHGPHMSPSPHLVGRRTWSKEQVQGRKWFCANLYVEPFDDHAITSLMMEILFEVPVQDVKRCQ